MSTVKILWIIPLLTHNAITARNNGSTQSKGSGATGGGGGVVCDKLQYSRRLVSEYLLIYSFENSLQGSNHLVVTIGGVAEEGEDDVEEDDNNPTSSSSGGREGLELSLHTLAARGAGDDDDVAVGGRR
jgi:hypothetical protein